MSTTMLTKLKLVQQLAKDYSYKSNLHSRVKAYAIAEVETH